MGALNSLHINILPYSIAKQTACDGFEGDFSSFSFFIRRIKEVGLLIAAKDAPHCLFNMHSQAHSHLVGSVLTNK